MTPPWCVRILGFRVEFEASSDFEAAVYRDSHNSDCNEKAEVSRHPLPNLLLVGRPQLLPGAKVLLLYTDPYRIGDFHFSREP